MAERLSRNASLTVGPRPRIAVDLAGLDFADFAGDVLRVMDHLGVRAAHLATLGDGSYMFGVPSACHQAARMHDLPILAVEFNNASWDEVRNSAANVHPDGWSVSTGNFPISALAPSPRYEEIVRAFDGHGERVEAPGELPGARAARGAQRAPPGARQHRLPALSRHAGRAPLFARRLAYSAFTPEDATTFPHLAIWSRMN